MMPSTSLLDESPFVAYSYAYPHKSAYRSFPDAIPLRKLWSQECRDALFLYLHLPFCESRCGYCNLFTTARPGNDFVTAYIKTLGIQAQQVRDALGDATFAQLAIGGGTPTFLDIRQLETVLRIVEQVMGVPPRTIPMSIEASPGTITQEKLTLLRQFGIDRLSVGVQSFDDRELKLLGRQQNRADVERALNQVREAGFPTLNIDLIYGAGQDMRSWSSSVAEALAYQPEEVYLYPLYVRSLTALASKLHGINDQRLEAYRAGRDLLLSAGYSQTSLRLFRKTCASKTEVPAYNCQEDGMVGLGCGARSYTRTLHYSNEYAVKRDNVLSILEQYVRSDRESFSSVEYGFQLDEEDQRRRYVIKSLLTGEGLNQEDYKNCFGTNPLTEFPELSELETMQLVTTKSDRIRLTPAGLERSDVVGPFLYSEKVRRLMEDCESC
jgi:oxygen-independent coproporphyrinogen III oxidase